MNTAVPEGIAEMGDMTRFSEIGIVSPVSCRESKGIKEFMNNAD
jgi:hypothetical protein